MYVARLHRTEAEHFYRRTGVVAERASVYEAVLAACLEIYSSLVMGTRVRLVEEVAAANDVTPAFSDHYSHRTEVCVPSGSVEYAVRHPGTVRAEVWVRRGVVRIIVVAEHPRRKRIRAAYCKSAGTLVHFAVAHDHVMRLRAAHADSAATLARTGLAAPFGNTVRVEPIFVLDVVGEALLHQHVSASLPVANDRQSAASVAEHQITHHEIRRIAQKAASLVNVAVTAYLRTHPLSIRTDLRPVLRRTMCGQAQFPVEHAPAFQQ